MEWCIDDRRTEVLALCMMLKMMSVVTIWPPMVVVMSRGLSALGRTSSVYRLIFAFETGQGNAERGKPFSTLRCGVLQTEKEPSA